MKCERCKVDSKGYALHDYCLLCSENLCTRCMANGCCGVKPARSGQDADADARGENETPSDDAWIARAKETSIWAARARKERRGWR